MTSRDLENYPETSRAEAVLVRDFLLRIDATQGAVLVIESALNTLMDALALAEHGNKSGPKPPGWSEIYRLGIAAASVTGLSIAAGAWPLQLRVSVVGEPDPTRGSPGGTVLRETINGGF